MIMLRRWKDKATESIRVVDKMKGRTGRRRSWGGGAGSSASARSLGMCRWGRGADETSPAAVEHQLLEHFGDVDQQFFQRQVGIFVLVDPGIEEQIGRASCRERVCQYV